MPLRAYQLEALAFLRDNKRAIYGDAPGTGKTPTACVYAQDFERVLVVVPTFVRHYWIRQLTTWRGGEAILYKGTPAKRAKLRESFVEGPAVVVMGYETMRDDIAQLIELGSWELLIADESHRLKNRKAQVRKAFAKLTRRADRVALLTGTPILSHAEELWSSLNALHPQGFTSYWRWANEHFQVTVTDFRGKVRHPVTLVGDLLPGHEDLLRQELMGVLIQRPLGALLPDMPDVTETTIEVELNPAERKQYNQLAKFDWTEIEGEPVIATSDVVRILRLRQLASDPTCLGSVTHGAKVRATVDLIDDIGEPVVVFTAFKQTARALKKALPKGYAVLHTGDESPDQREQAIYDFLTGKARVIIGTHGALGEGVDGLQAKSRHVIFVDRDWTPARNEQAIGRVRRSGQAQGVQVWNIVALDTVDQHVDAALAAKVSVIEALTGRTYEEIV